MKPRALNHPSNAWQRVAFNRTTESTQPTRSRPKAKRPSPITLRLTPAEREKLEELAQSMTLSAYIRMVLFADDVSPRKSSKRAPIKDHEALAQVLALLGHSKIANNLNQLSKAANAGALLVDQHTLDDLNEAYFHVCTMRQELITALGLKAS
ncbi:MAG: MobC family plasmid mobilization relaxosome protein [Alphaproteobacteria bacterium]|nr:MobC family plasmid mobilization relaxosome protein [Alphaproteobacteria bacterium]